MPGHAKFQSRAQEDPRRSNQVPVHDRHVRGYQHHLVEDPCRPTLNKPPLSQIPNLRGPGGAQAHEDGLSSVTRAWGFCLHLKTLNLETSKPNIPSSNCGPGTGDIKDIKIASWMAASSGSAISPKWEVRLTTVSGISRWRLKIP